jgi:putative ABC transport system permease protein
MRAVRAWFVRLGEVVFKQRRDAELAAEMESHLQMHVEEGIRAGMMPAEARRQAVIALGGVEQTKESYRDRRGFPALEAFLQDARFGLRMLRKNPGFTVIAVLTLALGISASTAMFSILYAVVLKPLPFAQQDRIVIGWKADPARGIDDAARKLRDSQLVELSYLDYKDLRDQSTSFQDLAAMPTTTNGYSYILTGQGEPKEVESSRVSANYFSVLRVTPYLGRDFRPEEDRLGANPVVILTYQFWQTQFSGNRKVVGSGIDLSGIEFTIIGVLPPEFIFPQGVDVFTPISTSSYGAPARAIVENRGAQFLQIVGRLKEGISPKKAEAELNTIVAGIAAQHPETKGEGQIAVIEPLQDYITGTNAILIYLLFAGSLVLLLVASINLASILAARAVSRGGEIVLRVALGAGKKRLFGQFLVEGLILAGIGTAAGVAVSYPLVRAIAHLAPHEIPRIALVSVNGWALSFTLGCLILTTLLFGITPVLLVREPELHTILKESSGSIASSIRGQKLGRIMIVLEISATLALIVVTGTVAKSFRNLQNVKLGFDADHVYTCAVFLSPTNYPDLPSRRRFYQDLTERLQARPEVLAAAAAVLRPLEGLVGWYADYILPGQTPDEARKNPRTNFEIVTPSYFQAIGTPLLAGRTFDEAEDSAKPLVAIMSESVARRMYGAASHALGEHFQLANNAPGRDWTVIGIVGDARYRQLNQVSGDIFVSYRQSPAPTRYVVVRTRNNPSAIASIVRQEIAQIDASQAAGEETTMRELVNVALARDRFHSRLLLLFGAGALVLAAVGVFGVVSDFVATRRRDLGIRMALGARPARIAGHVLRSAFACVLWGEALGILGGTVATTAIRATLFEVSPVDMISISGGCAVLVIVSLVACMPPALRAARTDLNQVLR